MRKNYLAILFVFAFGLLFSFTSQAQLIAVDDYGQVTNPAVTQVVIQDVLANDTLNGLPVSISQATYFQVSSTLDFLDINDAGSLIFTPTANVTTGTHLVQYYMEAPGGLFSRYANVYVTIGCPIVESPAITVTQPNCANPIAQVTISNFGLGRILVYSIDGGANMTVTSSSTTFHLNFPSLGSGNHMITAYYIDGQCYSAPTTATINSFGGVDLEITGVYNDFNANGHTDVGDVINYQFKLTNNTCNPATTLLVNGNMTVSGGPIVNLAPGTTDSTTFSGIYVLTQSDINAGAVTRYAMITSPPPVPIGIGQLSVTTSLNTNDGIKLVAFVDLNNNGIKDGSDYNFSQGSFNYTINGGTAHHVASYNDLYLFESNPANSYDISYTVQSEVAAYYTLATPAYTNITVAENSGIVTYNFPLTVIPFKDAQVLIYGTAPRPGFTYTNYIYYSNTGNQAIASGTVSFTKSNVVSITSISQSGTVPTANGFTYNFTNLMPNETRMITVVMQVPVIPTVTLGQLLTNSATVTVTDDVNSNNDDYSLAQTIVGSYDPNDKTEKHGGKILHSGFTSGDYLTYTIRFENTGTANAINVKVDDILEAKLDETTVKTIKASHNYTLDRVGNHLIWRFDGIDLPPSVENTTIGHGFVIFEVKPKPGYVLGDVITNSADIYFDFNPAIVTDPCTTEFVNSLATRNFTFDNFKYQPNPVKSTLSLSNDMPISRIVITSVLGQEVLSRNGNSLQAEIDMSGLSNGIYFVKAYSQEQTKTIKIVKE